MADAYDLGEDLERLRRSSGEWRDLALAMVCEATAALLVEVRPLTGEAMLRRSA